MHFRFLCYRTPGQGTGRALVLVIENAAIAEQVQWMRRGYA